MQHVLLYELCGVPQAVVLLAETEEARDEEVRMILIDAAAESRPWQDDPALYFAGIRNVLKVAIDDAQTTSIDPTNREYQIYYEAVRDLARKIAHARTARQPK